VCEYVYLFIVSIVFIYYIYLLSILETVLLLNIFFEACDTFLSVFIDELNFKTNSIYSKEKSFLTI